jgi:hypothetical protein
MPKQRARTKSSRPSHALGVAVVCAACVALLVVLGVMPVPSLARRMGSAGGHIAAYAAVVMLSFPFVLRLRSRLWLLAAFWVLGAFIELLQAHLAWRSGSLKDIGYNAVGLMAGAMIFVAIERLFKRAMSNRERRPDQP